MKKITFTVSTAIAIGLFAVVANPMPFTKDVCKEIANISGKTTTGNIINFLRLTRTEDGLKRLSETSGKSIDVLKKARTVLLASGAVDLGNSNEPVSMSEASVSNVLTAIALYYRITGRFTSDDLKKNAEIIAKNANIPVWEVLLFNDELTAFTESPDYVTGNTIAITAAVHAN